MVLLAFPKPVFVVEVNPFSEKWGTDLLAYPGVQTDYCTNVMPVSADVVGVFTMGFEPEEIGYLQYAAGKFGFERLGEGDLEKIKIVGLKPEQVRKKFKPHSGYEQQKKWQIPEGKFK